jgi:HlyD family secretion protein
MLGLTIVHNRGNALVVQTERVKRTEITAVVSATGEIKPKQYVNIGANAMGRITQLYVKEGSKVQRGELVAKLEDVQPAADLDSARAALQEARVEAQGAQAALKAGQADLARCQSDLDRSQLDFARTERLYKAGVMSKQDYESKQASWKSAAASVNESQAKILQAESQYASAQRKIDQAQASLVRSTDALSKTVYRAPFDGVVTNLPVHEGETVVMGIQNSQGSTLMTLADMAVITAEVKIDEADIVSVKLGQAAKVSIDAIPKRSFAGVVTEIGENAIVRSSGLATSQSATGDQEAKDFRVVITLQETPENLRPGLSCTAKIVTATRPNALAIPIQALTARQRKDLESGDAGAKRVLAAAPDSAPGREKDREKDPEREELQGVFVVRGDAAFFVEVETGINGASDLEVVRGLAEGDQIVTGNYRALRILKNGRRVRIDNSVSAKEESS